jgi:alkylmercury lyase
MDWFEMVHEKWGIAFFQAIPHVLRLLAEGRPVTLDRLATVSSLPVHDVEAALRQQPGTDWDDQGRLLGFGLTLRPTPHRFTFDGRTIFGWCASDTLMFPVALGKSGVVESPCPATGQQIKVEVTPERVQRVDPSSAVVSLVRPDKVDDIRGEVCALGNFFASSEAAGEWLAAHPEGMVHSVEEDFKLHRELMEKIGWAHVVSPAR